MLTKEQLEQIQYTNLVAKSHYSIPFGVGKIKDQISSAAKKGHRGIAIVDDFAMNGILEAYSLSKDKDFLKKLQKEKFPILLGTKINVTDSLDTQDSSLFNISIYAQNWQGYKNMTHLTSLSSMPGNGYINGDDKLVKRISLENLAERADGLLVGSGNIDGILSQSIMKGTGQEEDLIQIFKEIFGDNFFIELHFHPKNQFWNNTAKSYQPQNQDVQKVINLELIRLAKQYDIKCCLVQDSYMFDKKFDYIQNILIANHKDYKSSGFYFDTPKYMMSVSDMYEYIQKNADYITDNQFVDFCENSNFFVDKCKDIELEFEPALPKIEYMDHQVFTKEDNAKYETLFNDTWNRIKPISPAMAEIFKIAKIRKDIALETSLKAIIRLEKMSWENKEYLDRLALELKVLARNGVLSLLDYFLLLEDVTNFIRKHGYLRGFGRGSGGGSLLTYVMDISDIEPIKYQLLFERFFTQDKIGVQSHELENYTLKEYSTVKPKNIDEVVALLSEIESIFDKKRLKEINPEFLAKELYYIECNDEWLSYYKNLSIKFKADTLNVDNKNNSTLAYLLGISDQKPKKTIKQSEPSMPDFDYDTDGRDLVKKYLTEKNGVKHVTLIGTLGSLKTKGAIKDVIRQLRPDMDVTRDVNPLTEKFNVIKTTDEDKIRDTLQMAMTTKNIDYSSIDFKSELAYFYACLEADSKLHEWFENNKEVKDAVILLLGNAKGTGVHAGGIVVSRKEIMELCPLTWDHDEGLWVTQYEMAYVEKAGLIKYDFLGLKTLEDFNRCLKLVNSRHGTNYNLSNIPMEDKAIFELFVQGKTESVFQFNGNLPIAILTQLKEVRGIDDLAMITSIARPGPLKMGMDKVFIKRNTGEEPVEYLHPSLKPILENTYGILCIAKGQKVKTQIDGELNIESVKIGSYVLTEDGTYQKVLNNIYKGKKETVVIKFQKGQSLECTKDHKVLTNLGWVEAQFLIKNNEHLAVKHFDYNNKFTFDIVSSLTIKNELTDVYDLSIDKVHSFVVGGHVVHNCYQEHVLMIAQDIGELPPADSVKFMKALSKKKPETVEKLVQKIKKVAIDKHHFKEEVTKELMELIQAFSLYAFNKSHAAAYACVSYICMWLKHYYPAEWISAVLSGAKKEDLEILYPKWKDYIVPPSINQSKDTFQINENNKVVMPFGAVNGVGDKAVAEIIKMQPFTSFEDFMNRVNRSVVNKGPTLAMIFAGIFDEFKPEEETKQRWRKLLVRDYFKIKFSLSKPSKKDKEEAEAYFKEIVAMNRGQILMKEISVLNFTAFDYYEYYKDKMTDGAMAKFGKQAIRPADVSMYPTDSWVVVGGMIESIEFKRTKKGDEMAIIKLSNNGTSISIQVFPRQLEQDDASDSKLIRSLEKYSPIMIKGKVNRWEGRLSLVFDTAHLLL